MVFLLIVQVKIIKPKVLETVHENHGRKHFCLLKQNPLYLKKKKTTTKKQKAQPSKGDAKVVLFG